MTSTLGPSGCRAIRRCRPLFPEVQHKAKTCRLPRPISGMGNCIFPCILGEILHCRYWRMGETHVPGLKESLCYRTLAQYANACVGLCTRQSIECFSDRRFRPLQQLEKALITVEQHPRYLLGGIEQACLEQYRVELLRQQIALPCLGRLGQIDLPSWCWSCSLTAGAFKGVSTRNGGGAPLAGQGGDGLIPRDWTMKGARHPLSP